ncbi:hypothetical protein D3C86_1261870 [compost metagenome]
MQVGDRDFLAQAFGHVTGLAPLVDAAHHREHDPQRPVVGSPQQGAQLRFHDLRALQGQANAAYAEEGVFFLRNRPVRQRFVATDIEGTHHQRPPGQTVEDAAVLDFLGRLVGRLRVGHENQFGAQQANAFGALLHRAGHAGAFTNVGEHFDGVAIGGQRGLMAQFSCRLQALLAGIAFGRGALQGRRVSVHMQATPLAIEQQRRARRQQQHARAGADQCRNAQGPGDNRTVRRSATPGGENPRHASRVETRDVGRADLVHHQNVRLIRFARGFDATELHQHPTPNITQVGRTFGEQGILQCLLLSGRRFNYGHPRRLGAFALLEARIDLIGQFRVVEHLLVGDEDFADGFALAALDQALDVTAYLRQGVLEALALDAGGLAAQRVIDGLQHLNMRRADGDPRSRGNCLNHAA